MVSQWKAEVGCFNGKVCIETANFLILYALCQNFKGSLPQGAYHDKTTYMPEEDVSAGVHGFRVVVAAGSPHRRWPCGHCGLDRLSPTVMTVHGMAILDKLMRWRRR